MRPFDLFARQSRPVIWLISLAVLAVIGFLDYITGYEISFFLFYAFPILLMVWYADKSSAILMALLSTLIWWWADEATGHAYLENWHQVWNAGTRVAYFLSVVGAGTAIKARIGLLEHTQQLEREIIRISEREQERIGQDLHDGLCQYYAAVGCAAGSLRQRLQKASAEETADAAEIEDLIMKGVLQTRNLARGLSPVERDQDGLRSALEELASSASHLFRVECTFQCEEEVPIYDNTCATHLFRIAQEALNNAVKHGKATRPLISLTSSPDIVTLSVSDNGVGIPEPVPEGRGMGLSIMRYRARTFGGNLKIERNPDGGTLVSCSFRQQAGIETSAKESVETMSVL